MKLSTSQAGAVCELAVGSVRKGSRWVAAESLARKGFALRIDQGTYQLTESGLELVKQYPFAALRVYHANKVDKTKTLITVLGIYQTEAMADKAVSVWVKRGYISENPQVSEGWVGSIQAAAQKIAEAENDTRWR